MEIFVPRHAGDEFGDINDPIRPARMRNEIDKLRNEIDIKRSVIHPKVLEFEAAATNGLRICWDGPRKCTIEARDGDGWKTLKHVRNINILMSVDHALPVVTLEYYIFDLGAKT